MSEGSISHLDLIEKVYLRLAKNTPLARKKLGRSLTLTEKILFGHLSNPEDQELDRGQSYASFLPDRIAMQDATAQMALLQFMTAGLPHTAVPTTIHCDHLIQAHFGANSDLSNAQKTNEEVYNFLKSASQKYGIGFWKPGSGIIHQVVLEQYAFPGAMMIGTDSHTPNAGGLGMVAIGVGGADAVDVMVGQPFQIRWPRLIGIKLTGSLSAWSSAKDVILKVAGLLTVKGGTGSIIEYFGPGTSSISTTGKATICNMGAEVGATCSLFPYDDHAANYLSSTGRQGYVELAKKFEEYLKPDPEVELDPTKYFDQVLEINLSELEPYIVGPHTPDRSRPISQFIAEAKTEGWPLEISQCLVGSCTNSSYEDMARAANVARQAAAKGLSVKIPLLITPGSERIQATIERDGLLDDMRSIGAVVLANACGPCIGQWKRDDITEGQVNSILTSYNRNFPKRNDGNAQTLAFIASPEAVVAFALSGNFNNNPLSGPIDEQNFVLQAPHGPELPAEGFSNNISGYIEPASNSQDVQIEILPNSQRLQLLEPFPKSEVSDFLDLPILIKVKGKCTTDHISAAGPWLKYRGHLENISANLLLGAQEAFSGEIGVGFCPLHKTLEPIAEAASHAKKQKINWCIVADENYGEGSSREHAAMEPRFMGAKVILARSFARIHETNLKKQGILPLTFLSESTYEEIGPQDIISVVGISNITPGQNVLCQIKTPNGSVKEFYCSHSLTQEHIDWLFAGSALNLIREKIASNKK